MCAYMHAYMHICEHILRRQITRRCGPSSIAKMLPTRGEEEHVHSMSSMFLLKPTKHTYTPLSLTDKGPLKHRQRAGMLRIYMPDPYRGIDSMVSHWECRPSVWEHPGRVKAGMPTPRRRCPHAMIHMHAYGEGISSGHESHLVDTLDLKWARIPPC